MYARDGASVHAYRNIIEKPIATGDCTRPESAVIDKSMRSIDQEALSDGRT